MAASIFESSKCFKVFMMTLYGDSLLDTVLMPMRAGSWVTAMLMADPVMKAEMDVSETKSTSHPNRANPMKQTMAPVIIDKAEAMMWPGTSGSSSSAFSTTLPTTVDRTATGCNLS